MGIDVSAVNMIGIEFDSMDELHEFVKEHYDAPDEFDSDDIFDITNGLEFQLITAYSDSGGVLGVEIGEDDLDPDGDGVKRAWRKALELLPADINIRVQPHCWAQYW